MLVPDKLGHTRHASSPTDSVIEGDYTNYKVLHHFGTEYAFSVFSNEEYGCPAFLSIPIRSSKYDLVKDSLTLNV